MLYGVSVVQGAFGKGKTYMTFLDIYSEILNGRDDYVIISNIPYSFVDYFFSSGDDLNNLLRLIDNFIEVTNTDISSTFYAKQKTIYFIIDEAHLYFDSRNFAKGSMDVIMKQLTQCRKRNIKFVMITQKPGTIDLRFRMLADYTINLQKESFRGWNYYRAYWYENPGDITEIKPGISMMADDDDFKSPDMLLEQQSLLFKEIFRPLSDGFAFLALFRRSYRMLKREEYLTKYVTGYYDPDRVSLPTLSTYHGSQELIDFIDDVFYGNPPHMDYIDPDDYIARLPQPSKNRRSRDVNNQTKISPIVQNIPAYKRRILNPSSDD